MRAHVCIYAPWYLLLCRQLFCPWHSAVLASDASQGSWRGKPSKRLHAVVFLLWVIVCASAFLNKMPLSFLWGPLFPVPWVVFLCRFFFHSVVGYRQLSREPEKPLLSLPYCRGEKMNSQSLGFRKLKSKMNIKKERK